MAIHNDTGKKGELLACRYLIDNNYRVRICNWRQSHYEIDIIATKDGVVHFIEVKTRHSLKYGYPEESVSRKKFNNLKRAAECFLEKYPQIKRIQFDILSILIMNGAIEYFLIEDVYI